MSNNPLEALMGEEFKAICFVMDYVEFTLMVLSSELWRIRLWSLKKKGTSSHCQDLEILSAP